MEHFEQYRRRFFSEPNQDRQRMASINNAHVVCELGYEVKLSRNSVTYRDPENTYSIEAEQVSGGLLIFSSRFPDSTVINRINSALEFLNVKYEHQP